MSSNVFQVHPGNPRCFLYRGRPFKILTSAEHYGAVINADFDQGAYLEEMARSGQNMTRIFTFYRETDTPLSSIGAANTLGPRPEASVMPWQRVQGQGQAADGLGKFDLERWNPDYFRRFHGFLDACEAQGIVVEVTLFCNPYGQSRLDLFPCGAPSNVNGMGGDLRSPVEFMALSAPSIVAFQERFVCKLATELNRHDNLYYEICNEPRLGSMAEWPEDDTRLLAWTAHLARVIREAEAGLPKRHLIAANAHHEVLLGHEADGPVVRHEDAGYVVDPEIDIINYHYISSKRPVGGLAFVKYDHYQGRAGRIWPFLRARDGFGKPIIFDESCSGVHRGWPERYAVNRAEAWEMMLSGGAGYDNLDWSFSPSDERGWGLTAIDDGRHLDGRPLRAWYALLREFLGAFRLEALEPAEGLLPEVVEGCGYAASTDGQGSYALYLVDERLYRQEPCPARRVALSLYPEAGAYRVETYDPRTGERRALPPLASDGAAHLEVEFTEDVAITLGRVAG